MYHIKEIALAIFLGGDPIDGTISDYDDNEIKVGNRYYKVCSDEEADDEWDGRLDSYLEECILSEIPEFARNYFDAEKWKADARHDGRGVIGSYDGIENHIKLSKEALLKDWLPLFYDEEEHFTPEELLDDTDCYSDYADEDGSVEFYIYRS